MKKTKLKKNRKNHNLKRETKKKKRKKPFRKGNQKGKCLSVDSDFTKYPRVPGLLFFIICFFFIRYIEAYSRELNNLQNIVKLYIAKEIIDFVQKFLLGNIHFDLSSLIKQDMPKNTSIRKVIIILLFELFSMGLRGSRLSWFGFGVGEISKIDYKLTFFD